MTPHSLTKDTRCEHLGDPTGDLARCTSCRGVVQLRVFRCDAYGSCTIGKPLAGMACCAGTRLPGGTHSPCPSYKSRQGLTTTAPVSSPTTSPTLATPMATNPPTPVSPSIRWAYGVTTVPIRRTDLLPRTLESLRKAGFDQPRLFVDGVSNSDATSLYGPMGLPVTARFPVVRTFGNWILSIGELFLRDPNAQRYAIFQDDLVTYPGLREYLDKCVYPEKGYWNLYTMPSNQQIAPKGQTGKESTGWYRSNQFGRGAVALVFSQEALITLLTQPHMVTRPLNAHRGHRSVDGGIVSAMNKAGWLEYVHNPSLTQHTGLRSSMGNAPHAMATSFKGEAFNAMALV